MTVNQILGTTLVVAGVSDVVAAFVIRARLPPDRARIVIGALSVTSAGLIGAGIVLLVRG